MKEAFTYCWSDKLTAKIYVGYHKGSVTDGYVCSSKEMMVCYLERPDDFSREILFCGTCAEAFTFEQKIIKQLIKSPETTYNKRFGGSSVPWNKGKSGEYSDEHIKKISDAATGRKHTDRTKEKISQNNTNRGKSGNWKNAVKENHYDILKKLFTGKKMSKISCPYCFTEASKANATRWHFENCRSKI